MSEGTIIPRPIKRGQPAWLLKYDAGPDPVTGKRRQRYKTVRGSESAAKAELRRLVTAVEDGEHVDRSKTTLAEFARDWLTNVAAVTLSGKTHERYSELIEGNIIPAIGDTALQKLTATKIEAFYAEALKSGRRDGKGGLHPRTVRHIHRVLSLVLASAEKKKIIKASPMSAVENVPSVDDAEIQVLEENELAALLRSVKGTSIHMPVLLAATTGMRRGEILGLRWQDIDLDGCALTVRQSIEETKAGLAFKAPKTKASIRTITLPAFVVTALRDHRREQAEQRLALGLGKDKNDLVFTNPEGEPRRPRNFSKEFSRCAKRAGVGHVSLHGLRHTHATQLLKQGVNVKVVSERLGHANISITLQIYAHALPSMQAEAAAMIDATLGRASQE